MARIGIITQLHPSANPRVVKEANTLAAEGHEVFLVTILQMPGREQLDASVLDRRVQVVGVDLVPGRAPALRRLVARARRYAAVRLTRFFGVETLSAICHSPGSLLAAAIALKCDLYIGHIEAGLWAGRELIRRGYRVGFDIEDWHSQDGLSSARRNFPLKRIAELEGFALRHGAFVTTTSAPMAAALAAHYGAPVPAVVKNVFPRSDWEAVDGEFRDRTDRSRPSLIWFSQTIGPGRGLEELWQALPQVSVPIQIHLRGNARADFVDELRRTFPSAAGHTLHVHPLVPHHQLMSRIAEHDIGLAIERCDPANKDLTLSNKIFQYLLAGLAVVATDTSGQRDLASQWPEAIQVAESTGESLAQAITGLISDPARLQQRRHAARRIADAELNWDKERECFLDLVNRALTTSC